MQRMQANAVVNLGSQNFSNKILVYPGFGAQALTLLSNLLAAIQFISRLNRMEQLNMWLKIGPACPLFSIICLGFPSTKDLISNLVEICVRSIHGLSLDNLKKYVSRLSFFS